MDEELDDETVNQDDIDDPTTTTKSKLKGLLKSMASNNNNEIVEDQKHGKMKPFKETRIHNVLEYIGQASKIGFSVIIVDCTTLILRMMGYNPYNIMEHVSRVFSKCAYTGWVLVRISILKRYLLGKSFGKFQLLLLSLLLSSFGLITHVVFCVSSTGSDLGKMNVVDNLADGVLYLVFLFYMLNYLEVQTGLAVKVRFCL